MSQLNVNVVAPLGYTGPDLTGDNNFVQIVDNLGYTVFKTDLDTNVAVGLFSMYANTSGISNVGVGPGSLGQLISTNQNSALGNNAGNTLTSGNNNVFVGHASAPAFTSGDQNIFIGVFSGASIGNPTYQTSGNNNIHIGYNTRPASNTASNAITLGNSSNNVLRCAVTTITSLSDERDKKEIQELPVGLEFVEKLKPVKFVWNDRDEEGKHDVEDFGFIAQDLKAAQEESKASYLNLVYDENPEKLEASYGKLLPVLVKSIQEMSSEIKLLKEEILTLKTK